MATTATIPSEMSLLAQQMLLSSPVLPQDLMVEILSWVPVKALIRFRCVCKTWNSLVFDPTFVKLHLQRSSKNTHVLLTFTDDIDLEGDMVDENFLGVAPCTICRLLENPSLTIDDSLYRFNDHNFVFGTCNGLVCLRDYLVGKKFSEYWVRFWNPTTKIISADSPRLSLHSSNYKIGPYSVQCGFGFDDWCDTYKVVVVLWDIKSQEREVRVHCMGDTCWRKTLTCPTFHTLGQVDGQFVSGTINWLALRGLSFEYQWKNITIDQLVIFSYDLKTETNKYLSMPNGLLEVPPDEPYLGVLKGCLCLSVDPKRTHFVLWMMREFGNENSWVQLLNISYIHLLPFHDFPPCTIMPLCMSENEDVLLLANYGDSNFVVYNRRDNRIERTHAFKDYIFSFFSYNYVESLVLPY